MFTRDLDARCLESKARNAGISQLDRCRPRYFFFVVVAVGFSPAAKISTALGVRVRLSVHHRMPEAVGHMGSSARSSLLLTLFVLVCSCSLF